MNPPTYRDNSRHLWAVIGILIGGVLVWLLLTEERQPQPPSDTAQRAWRTVTRSLGKHLREGVFGREGGDK